MPTQKKDLQEADQKLSWWVAIFIGEFPRTPVPWSTFGNFQVLSVKTGARIAALVEMLVTVALIVGYEMLPTNDQTSYVFLHVFAYQTYYITVIPSALTLIIVALIPLVYRRIERRVYQDKPSLPSQAETTEGRLNTMDSKTWRRNVRGSLCRRGKATKDDSVFRELPAERPPPREGHSGGLFRGDSTLISFQVLWAMHFHIRITTTIIMTIWCIWWVVTLTSAKLTYFQPAYRTWVVFYRLAGSFAICTWNHRVMWSLLAYRDICACGGRGDEHSEANVLWIQSQLFKKKHVR